MKALRRKHSSIDLARPKQRVFIAMLVIVVACGCHKKSGSPLPMGLTPTDPQMTENLAKLTYELRRATPRHHITNFEGFVAVSQAEIPPPPPGQKYAIGQGWKVVLIDANSPEKQP